MKHILENGKVINISDKEIQNYMIKLDLSKEEAIDLWLEENDYQENEELNKLDDKAKKVKINHGVANEKPKEKKPHTVKVSDEKITLFNMIFANLSENFGENAQIIKENKEICIKIGEKSFKVDIVEHRKPKN